MSTAARLLFTVPLAAALLAAAVEAGEPGRLLGLSARSSETGRTPDRRAGKFESILGREVRTRDEGDAGRIVDLLGGADGNVHAAVIEFGGFLGIGTRKIAVEWPAVHLDGEGRQATGIVDVTRDQLRVAPEWKPSEPVVLVRASR